MSKICRFLGVSALLSASFAIPQTPAFASTWGCQVLLCLSNPGGPTQYAECVPPITKLWNALAKGNPFPSCSEGGATGTKVTNFLNRYFRIEMAFDDGRKEVFTLDARDIQSTPGEPGGNYPDEEYDPRYQDDR